jgi:hypothetical protein
MKIFSAAIGSIVLFAMLAGAARADEDPNANLLATVAKLTQQCEEKARQEKANLESKVAQAPNLPPEQRTEIAQTVQKLDHVIETTTNLLADPALKTGGDSGQLAARMYAVVSQSKVVEISAQRELGVPPTSRTLQLLVTDENSKKSFEDRFSQAWDGSPFSNSKGADYAGEGTGTNFFAPAVVAGTYSPTTAASAAAVVARYGSPPGGVGLEGTAGGLGAVRAVRYDPAFNALVMDDRLVYFITMPPWDAAALCRDIAGDNKSDDPNDRHDGERVAVSMGLEPKDNVIYGAHSTYQTSDVAADLFLSDAFLAGIVFGPNDQYDWTYRYKFPMPLFSRSYDPHRVQDFAPMLVFFTFKDFNFTPNDDVLRLANLSFDVTLMPLGTARAPDGGLLPDYAALQNGWEPPPAFQTNAQFLTSQFPAFRRERLIAKALAYGELAALFRSYKEAGIDLSALASDMINGLANGD